MSNDPHYVGETFVVNLEDPTWGTQGWANGDGVEGRVAGALLDLADSANEPYWDARTEDPRTEIWQTFLRFRSSNFNEFWRQRGQAGFDVGPGPSSALYQGGRPFGDYYAEVSTVNGTGDYRIQQATEPTHSPSPDGEGLLRAALARSNPWRGNAMRWFVVLAVLLAGCGVRTPVPPLPDGLVLRSQQLVGMPSPDPASVPEFSLYGDGTVIRPGPRKGALQTAESVRIGRTRALEFYRQAHDLGLAKDQEIPNTSVVDGYLQVFVLNSDGQRFVTKAATPDESSDLARFRSALRVDGSATPYRPTRIAAVGWAPDDTQDGRPWPFAPMEQRILEGTCVVLDAAQATTVASEVPQGTRWRSGATTYIVVFRPLLPDESTCDDLDV